ncbi:MAG: sigma factor-like helix-turn-helix DNA-binding protein [Erysipelotrichaceae bacterium]|nr:sigma factor-like helix-turn-helix DNA-binding protein [Erysipelotrichaceae bacterium]
MRINKQDGNLLLGFYGSLLTDHQQNILSDYFVDDLSMQEIAENEGISKSAVSDIINRSIIQLQDYENKLYLIKENDELEKLISTMEKDEKVNEKYIKQLRKIIRG